MATAAEVLVVDVKAVAIGYRVSKLLGRSVVNDKDEEIGTLMSWFSAIRTRAVLEIGGFLGIGGQLCRGPVRKLGARRRGRSIEDSATGRLARQAESAAID
jgi:hypothetical protein